MNRWFEFVRGSAARITSTRLIQIQKHAVHGRENDDVPIGWFKTRAPWLSHQDHPKKKKQAVADVHPSPNALKK